MNRWPSCCLPSASVLALLVAGCSAAATGDTSPLVTGSVVTAAGATTRAPLTAITHGRAKRVAEALGQVGLRDDQRAQLESLAGDMEAERAGALAAQRDLADALASQVEGGALDRAVLSTKVATLSAAWAAMQPKERAAFESVHAILDPGQRAELVAAMESHGGPHGEHDRDERGGWEHGRGHGGGQRWADDLQLSDVQRVAFFQILHDGLHEGHGFDHAVRAKERGLVLLEAFKGDTFSFDAVAPPEDVSARVGERASHFLDLAEKVLPLLTPAQRTLAAQKIREHVDQLPVAP